MQELNKDRRSLPRYKTRIACSVEPSPFASDGTVQTEERHAVVGHTEDVSLECISLVLSSNPTCGTDPSRLGMLAEIQLALPVGYARLSGSLVRDAEASPQEHLFVFRIEGGDDIDWRLYHEHLASLSRGQPS